MGERSSCIHETVKVLADVAMVTRYIMTWCLVIIVVGERPEVKDSISYRRHFMHGIGIIIVYALIFFVKSVVIATWW